MDEFQRFPRRWVV